MTHSTIAKKKKVRIVKQILVCTGAGLENLRQVWFQCRDYRSHCTKNTTLSAEELLGEIFGQAL